MSSETRALSGVPALQPSALTDSTMSASARGRAWARSSRTGKPSQLALPTRLPAIGLAPTGLALQVSVLRCSTIGLASSSAYVRVISSSTSPVTVSRQVSGSMIGTCRAVSIR